MINVIKVENVSKVYNLGVIGSGTLSDDINRAFARLTGMQDPLKKLDDSSDASGIHVALRNVNFDVTQGEVLGIIGKNGAGKSTLLKILSRITSPTTGRVLMKGRVASLLEVGTGFHPELTGRENIFLNGAILGMTRNEITRKFDEIVEFSGVSKFIDTPVKRYSSGMYVRLAFAVAAHLEPEILIVDEVLAVGDADFQKKCLGKMKDVSSKGRTVLFVSHNMEAVKNLCRQVVLMEKGEVIEIGDPKTIVNTYFKRNTNYFSHVNFEEANAPGNEKVSLLKADLILNSGDVLDVTQGFDIQFEFAIKEIFEEFNCSLNLHLITGEHIFNSQSPSVSVQKGKVRATISIPSHLMNNGDYTISIMAVSQRSVNLFYFENILSFEIFDSREHEKWFGEISGAVRPKLDWKLAQ